MLTQSCSVETEGADPTRILITNQGHIFTQFYSSCLASLAQGFPLYLLGFMTFKSRMRSLSEIYGWGHLASLVWPRICLQSCQQTLNEIELKHHGLVSCLFVLFCLEVWAFFFFLADHVLIQGSFLHSTRKAAVIVKDTKVTESPMVHQDNRESAPRQKSYPSETPSFVDSSSFKGGNPSPKGFPAPRNNFPKKHFSQGQHIEFDAVMAKGEGRVILHCSLRVEIATSSI